MLDECNEYDEYVYRQAYPPNTNEYTRPYAITAPAFLFWESVWEVQRSQISTYEAYLFMRYRRLRELRMCNNDYSITMFRKQLRCEDEDMRVFTYKNLAEV